MIQLISTRILICLGASNSSESDMIGIQNSQSEAAIGYIDRIVCNVDIKFSIK